MLAEKMTDEKSDQYEKIHEGKGESSKWPAVDKMAYQGLAGEIVETIDPHTESDPIAILGHSLCMFGNIIGRSAHFRVEADRHYTNTNALFVGATAQGRKGTAEGIVKELFTLNTPDALDWKKNRVKSGLSSGEGVVHHVRNETENDDGVLDKRLYIREPEFGGVLRTIARTGNTLSALIRLAWDSGDLGLLTRNNPENATNAHISIIGHITAQELRRYFSETEIFNGLANRFLWFCVKRSKLLPEGGKFFEMDVSELRKKIEDAIEFAKTVGEVKRDDAATKIWHEVYPSLSTGKPNLTGAILSRATPHVLRLALLYALLDRSATIKEDHLCAALAVWEYVEASVHYIFGNGMADDVAERIFDAVAYSVNGLTRTEISCLFSKHAKRNHIDDAVAMLVECGKVEILKIMGSGRPIEKIIPRTTSQAK